ncbi:hypothetical protein TRIUR3_23996 [Triticum urartu]|nr:hypothetical protein TRIUR3_23996 [Triticum urartu]
MEEQRGVLLAAEQQSSTVRLLDEDPQVKLQIVSGLENPDWTQDTFRRPEKLCLRRKFECAVKVITNALSKFSDDIIKVHK